ncbi:MAG: LysE family transporter [Bacteroidota bacterium]
MNFLLIFLVGIGIALMSSVPVGPINFAIIQAVFMKGKTAAFMIGVGGMIADVIYCFLALLLYGAIAESDSPAIFTWLNLITIPVVVFLGVMMIKKRNDKPEPSDKKEKAGNGILMGMMLGISNPVLFAYWVWVASYIQADGWITAQMTDYIAFAAGVATGVTAFFIGLVNIAAIGSKRMTDNFRSKFSLLVGIGFILFGVYLAVRFLVTEVF